jgi:hypothetical protein
MTVCLMLALSEIGCGLTLSCTGLAYGEPVS